MIHGNDPTRDQLINSFVFLAKRTFTNQEMMQISKLLVDPLADSRPRFRREEDPFPRSIDTAPQQSVFQRDRPPHRGFADAPFVAEPRRDFDDVPRAQPFRRPDTAPAFMRDGGRGERRDGGGRGGSRGRGGRGGFDENNGRGGGGRGRGRGGDLFDSRGPRRDDNDRNRSRGGRGDGGRSERGRGRGGAFNGGDKPNGNAAAAAATDKPAGNKEDGRKGRGGDKKKEGNGSSNPKGDKPVAAAAGGAPKADGDEKKGGRKRNSRRPESS